MNLIEVYVHEVTRRLPEKMRKDIAMELQSTIEDMLPTDYTEENVKIVLAQLGDPVELAYKYRDQKPALIGPAYFDQYISTLKMVLPIVITVVLVVFFIEEFISFTNESGIISFFITLFSKSISTVISIIIQVLFWVTLVFFIIERTNVSPDSIRKTGEKWKPDDLKSLTTISKQKMISKGEVFASLIWTAVWATIYFNAMHFIGVYERNEQGILKFITPTFNQDVLMSFWPIVVIFIGIEIALAIFKWVTSQWTYKLAIVNTVYQVLYCLLFIVIIRHPEVNIPDRKSVV